MEINDNLSAKGKIDFNLVKAAVEERDEKAFAELMHRYRDSIYFMLLKMVNNRDDAEDLTMEAFGKAFRNLSQYTPDYAFSTWLFRIATNNCIDFIRKKKKMTFSIDKGFENDEGEEMAMNIKADVLDPEEKMIREQKNEIMRNLVEKLPPRYKQLVELRYFKEYSYEEISVTLKLPLGTVKAQLWRAREFLFDFVKNAKENI